MKENRRMSKQTARRWVNAHRDGDEMDAGDLEAAFAAIFGQQPTDEDRAGGLWNYLFSAVGEVKVNHEETM